MAANNHVPSPSCFVLAATVSLRNKQEIGVTLATSANADWRFDSNKLVIASCVSFWFVSFRRLESVFTISQHGAKLENVAMFESNFRLLKWRSLANVPLPLILAGFHWLPSVTFLVAVCYLLSMNFSLAVFVSRRWIIIDLESFNLLRGGGRREGGWGELITFNQFSLDLLSID